MKKAIIGLAVFFLLAGAVVYGANRNYSYVKIGPYVATDIKIQYLPYTGGGTLEIKEADFYRVEGDYLLVKKTVNGVEELNRYPLFHVKSLWIDPDLMEY